MAIGGAGGWVPSNVAVLKDGHIVFVAITQNKPKSVVEKDPARAAKLLLAGELVTVDMRHPYQSELRAMMYSQLPGMITVNETPE